MNMTVKYIDAKTDKVAQLTIDTLADYDWQSDYQCDDRDGDGNHTVMTWVSREAVIDNHIVTIYYHANEETALSIDKYDVTAECKLTDDDDIDHTIGELIDALDLEGMYKECEVLDNSDCGYAYGVQMANDGTVNDMTYDEAHDYAVAHGGGTVIREDVLTHEVKAMETVEAAKDLADYKSDDDDEYTEYQWAVVVTKSGEPMVKVGNDVSNYKRTSYHHDDLREALEYRRERRNYLQDDGMAVLVVVRNYDTIVDWVD